jgi:hypothetical protein
LHAPIVIASLLFVPQNLGNLTIFKALGQITRMQNPKFKSFEKYAEAMVENLNKLNFIWPLYYTDQDLGVTVEEYSVKFLSVARHLDLNIWSLMVDAA